MMVRWPRPKGEAMRRLTCAVLLAALTLPLVMAGTADALTTWDSFREDHRQVLTRGLQRPRIPKTGTLSIHWLEQRAEFLGARQQRVDRLYHRWQNIHEEELAALVPSPTSPAPPVHYDGDHLDLWLCIHAQEGSWTDPNPPYFGGLQMGYGFMEAYGGDLYATKGTADHWTPDEQIGVAEAAWAINNYTIGWLFSQWPNTAPPCV
jgi:hypothetical protein